MRGGFDQRDPLCAFGHFLFADRDDLLLGDRERLHRICHLGLGNGLFDRLIDDGDEPLLVDNLYFLVALDLKSLDEFPRRYPQLVELAAGHNARILDFAKSSGFRQLDLLVLLNFEPIDLLVPLQPLNFDIVALEDDCSFLIGIGQFIDDANMLVLLHQQRFDRLFDFDAVRLDLPLAFQFCLVDPGRSVGLYDRHFLARVYFGLPYLALVLDTLRFDFHARDDTLRLEGLRCLDSPLLVLLLAVNLEQPNFGLAVDTLGLDELVLGDADALRLLLSSDLRVADTDRGIRTLLLDRSELRGPPRLDVARLVEPRVFKVTINFNGTLFGLVILELDLQTRIIFDTVSELAAPFDFLGELRQPFSVEGIVRIEYRDVGLI